MDRLAFLAANFRGERRAEHVERHVCFLANGFLGGGRVRCERNNFEIVWFMGVGQSRCADSAAPPVIDLSDYISEACERDFQLFRLGSAWNK